MPKGTRKQPASRAEMRRKALARVSARPVDQLQRLLREHARAVREIDRAVGRIIWELKFQPGFAASLVLVDALEASRGLTFGGGLIGAARELERAAGWTPKRVAAEQAELDRLDAAERKLRASRRAA